MAGQFNHLEILERLEKALGSADITAVKPEDLEIEAHNTLWNESDPTELTILKLLPSVKAEQVLHEFTKMTSFGLDKSGATGFFGENSLPSELKFGAVREQVNIRLMGQIAPTTLLASLERTQKAWGATGAEALQRIALRKNVLKKKARAMYFSDTRATRQGASGVRFSGLLQQIQEGTDGTSQAASPYGTHVIDLKGAALTIDNIRERVGRAITLFGAFTCLVMDPLVRGDLEGSMDGMTRLNLPIASSPYMVGQQISGIQSQGGVVYFHTDNTLSPTYATGTYDPTLEDGSPSTLPLVTSTVAAEADNTTAPVPVGLGNPVSVWDAASAGEIYYVLTEVVDEREGLGRRFPAVAGGYITVASGQQVKFTVTTGDALADSVRVYRGSDEVGTDDGTDLIEAYFIFETPGSGDGSAIVFYDNNVVRPNTSTAFGLRVLSKSAEAMHSGGGYHSARENSATFLTRNDTPMNTVAVATLGPALGILNLATTLAHVSRPLMYSALAMEVRNPYQQVVFRNVGLRT